MSETVPAGSFKFVDALPVGVSFVTFPSVTPKPTEVVTVDSTDSSANTVVVEAPIASPTAANPKITPAAPPDFIVLIEP